MRYFIFKDDDQLGPFEEGLIRAMLGSGELSKEDLACPEGGSEWLPVGTLVPGAAAPAAPGVPRAVPQSQAAPPQRNTNLEAEWNVYLAYSDEIKQMTDLLGEVDERQAKSIHKDIEHKLLIARKHIDSVAPLFPHSLEVKSMEADYLFNSAVKKLWEHGFYHRAADKAIKRGEAKGHTFTGLGVAFASRALANQKEKANANVAIQLLTQSLSYLESSGTRMARANVFNALGQKQAALQDLDHIITNDQGSESYIPARQLKAEIETPPKKGMCFVATAACGDYSAPEVVYLSEFRDRVLRKSRGGRMLIYWYYRCSPPVASVVGHFAFLRWFFRKVLIKPVIILLKNREEGGLSESPNNYPLPPKRRNRMKTRLKRIRPANLILISVMFSGLLLSVNAQKKPFLLNDKTALSPVSKSTYQEVAEKYKETPNKENRDALIFLTVSQIDYNFRNYQRTRRIGRNLFETVMDILEIGVSTAISLSNGERAKTVLAESLTFLKGGRESATKNLRLLEMQILFNKMIEKRSEVLIQILEKSDLTHEQYPFERAMVDLVAYYNAGTMDSALAELGQDTGEAAKNSSKELADAKVRAGIVGKSSQEQIDAADNNFKILRSIFEQHFNLQKTVEAENNKPDPDQDVIKSAEENQAKVLDGVRGLFLMIEADPDLSPLLEEIPKKYGRDNPAAKQRLESGLSKLKNDLKNSSIDDLEFILLKLNGVIIEKMGTKPRLNESLVRILKTYKGP